MSSGGGGGTQVVKTDPPAYQIPYIKAGLDQAGDILDQPTVTPFSPTTEQALALQQQRALAGNPLLGMGQNQAMQTLGGEYMYGGPGFDAYADAAWSSVRPNVDSMFARSGRSGSPLHSEALGRGFGRAMAPLYNSERGRQMQAAFGAPGLAMADYGDIGQLAAVGGAQEGKAQQYLDDPYNRLARYMGLIQGGYGGTQTTTGGAGGSPLMGALGGGLAGAGAVGGLTQAGIIGGASSPWLWPIIGGSALLGALGS